jgi:hypothetical protein
MKLIYILRSQCDQCHLDKMDVFYRIPNATPSEFIKQLKPHIRRKFRTEYGCKHTVKFTREIDKAYMWDEVNGKEVPR